MKRKRRLSEITLALIRERTIESNGCWLWQGSLSHGGYGRVQWRIDGVTRVYTVHRLTYQLVNGAIPAGLELDHVCRIRRCVNPEHVEAVTRRENIRRGASHIAVYMNRKTPHANG